MSGKCDHLSPVWFHVLAIRQLTRTPASEQRHTTTPSPVASPACVSLLSSTWILLSSVVPRCLVLISLYAVSPTDSLVSWRPVASCGMTEVGGISLVFKTDRLQCSRPIRRQTVTVRKYHVWCSSSTKLLDSRLTVWKTAPPSRNRPTACWEHTYNERKSYIVVGKPLKNLNNQKCNEWKNSNARSSWLSIQMCLKHYIKHKKTGINPIWPEWQKFSDITLNYFPLPNIV